jgi:CheY-like chemotaxis protein
MEGGGTLTIAAKVDEIARGHPDLKPGRYVRLSVRDTGVGMDDTILARAVEPFFSTKGVGKGTGLGLSMVHGLAAQLGGAIAISSKLGAGTTVRLWLPIASTGLEASEPREPKPLHTSTGTALLVDDEELARMSTADMLEELGYEVVEADCADQALRLLSDGLQPSVLVTDHLMPGLTGTELARAVRREHADVPVLLISGFAEVDEIAADLPRLTKPFRQHELAMSLAALPQARVSASK